MGFISRRDFLKSAGLASAAGMFWNSRAPLFDKAWGPALAHWDGSTLGRILLSVHTVYSQPDWRSPAVGAYRYNDVVSVLGIETGYGLNPSNNNYIKTDQGYIYSSWVQPVENSNSNPAVPIGEGGAWGEVSVPIAYSKNTPDDASSDRERLYYSQVYRVTGNAGDYYQIGEVYGESFYLKASQVRLIPPEEVTPISPDVDPGAKRIEISIRDQRLWAYEGDQEVFETLVATGMPDTPTPMWTFPILDKRHGQRMIGGKTGGGYNLPGIPWINYITHTWVALHGCYWHNDYGRRHSNGCINLMPADAKWLFRWTTPFANYSAYSTISGDPGVLPGTNVKIRW